MNHLPINEMTKLYETFPARKRVPATGADRMADFMTNWTPPQDLAALVVLHQAMVSAARAILHVENMPRSAPAADMLEDFRDCLYGLAEDLVTKARTIRPRTLKEAETKAEILLRVQAEFGIDADAIDELTAAIATATRKAMA